MRDTFRSPHEYPTLLMDVSKTKSSFYRRLYVAHLIDSGIANNVPALTEATGMPRLASR